MVPDTKEFMNYQEDNTKIQRTILQVSRKGAPGVKRQEGEFFLGEAGKIWRRQYLSCCEITFWDRLCWSGGNTEGEALKHGK